MKLNRTNPEVDIYLSKASRWQEEMKELRLIALDCGLAEELKWSKPCYTFQGKNIVIIQGFKEYCAFLSFKGVLLNDNSGILVKTGENTKVGRQIRFTGIEQIVRIKTVLKDYIKEAIEIEKAGLGVGLEENAELIIPAEFQNKLDEIPALRIAFYGLTPGRQRAYIFYFSAPKQSKTRKTRIEKYIQKILDGKGLNN